MNQALYAHMNNKRKMKKKRNITFKLIQPNFYFEPITYVGWQKFDSQKV
jgi:hypothetical protein